MGTRFEGRPIGQGWRITVAASAVALVICVISIAWFYAFLQDKLFAERQAFFTQFAEKTAENIDLAIDDYWHCNQMCQEFLAVTEPSGKNELVDNLAYCSQTIATGCDAVLAFAEDGCFYSSDGHVGLFGHDTSISFDRAANVRQIAIVNLPYESNDKTYFLLFTRMDRSLKIEGGKSITHLALAIDVDMIHRQFTSKSFDENCHVYFVTDTGRKLYQSSASHRFIEGYNVLASLEESAEVIGGGGMGDMLASFEADDATAFEISYKGEEWFVSFQTITEEDHHLVIFVPTSLIGNNAAVLSSASLWFLLFICLLLAGLFVVVLCSIRTVLSKLKQVNELLEKEAQAADRANHAKSEFLSYMSHDIRTPINGIMGMVAIAKSNEGNHAKVMDCLGKIDEASNHLLSLINDVLDMSRIEQGRTSIAYEPVNLTALFDKCRSIIEGQLDTRNLTFACDYGDLPNPHVMADELHLRQILINILGNAVKFTPDGGTVTFRARQEEAQDGDGGVRRARLTMVVEDTGIGMEQSYLQHIWEPFSQSRQGHCATYEGTGLGLAITKRFVDMMGGKIAVESELGKGSAFTVSLMVDVNPDACPDFAPEDEPDTLDGLKVLLVEDMELNREIAHELLRESGANVTEAEDGATALTTFLNAPAGSFDVILMDVMMPVMNGYEATRAIRSSAHPEARSIPVIALTANAFDEDVRRSLDAGMDGHLSKPIDMRALVKVLSKYRKEARGGSQ